jgi:hypothetical protein
MVDVLGKEKIPQPLIGLNMLVTKKNQIDFFCALAPFRTSHNTKHLSFIFIPLSLSLILHPRKVALSFCFEFVWIWLFIKKLLHFEECDSFVSLYWSQQKDFVEEDLTKTKLTNDGCKLKTVDKKTNS